MLIDEKKCLELARVGLLLEEAFHAPQDVEFVVKDGEIFIVQVIFKIATFISSRQEILRIWTWKPIGSSNMNLIE